MQLFKTAKNVFSRPLRYNLVTDFPNVCDYNARLLIDRLKIFILILPCILYLWLFKQGTYNSKS